MKEKHMTIQIHLLFYVFMIASMVTGYFKDFSMIMILIFIHECGHILMSSFFHWKIEKIIILPFGGLTLFHESLNRPLKEELMIVLAGPMMQVIGYLILKNWICDSMFSFYHYFILGFNLLPIVPLDGSKILQVLGNYIVSFYESQILTLWFSLLTLLCLFFYCLTYSFNFILYLTFFFLGLEWIKELKRRRFVFSKFLLERYQNYYPFKKYKTIFKENAKKMKRDYRHVFYQGKKCYSEREFLHRMFDFKRKL